MIKIHLSYRNERGHMKSVDPMNVPADAPLDVVTVAGFVRQGVARLEASAALSAEKLALAAEKQALRDAKLAAKLAANGGEKRGRGRPKGYKCSQDTVAKMVEGRRKTWMEKRQQEMAAAWEDVDAEQRETDLAHQSFEMECGA